MTFIFLNEGCNRQPVIFSTTIGKWLKVSIQYYPPSYERMDKYKLIAHLVQLARYAGTMMPNTAVGVPTFFPGNGSKVGHSHEFPALFGLSTKYLGIFGW